ncbi:MAG TPA: sulfite exporter TauE/SafE family protein [Draconibacterium sp.]|nr:sulfite exporter TauE/SafE family protein [Draconibacterium sp.]
MMTDFLFFALVFSMAVLYSSVGHGGASGYLALMALFSFPPDFMRPTALVLNIFVSSIAFYSFYRGGHFRLKLLLPFIVTSLPFAFLGGMFSINPKIYKIILGLFLLVAVARIFFKPQNTDKVIKPINYALAMGIGAVLGFLSGLIGIGGGIILSPIIILLMWADMKQTAAVSAAFILINSVSGLLGQSVNSLSLAPQTIIMLVAAITGGIAGSYIGSTKATSKALVVVLSSVLFFASIKLIFL